MYEILEKKQIAPSVNYFRISAPRIAKRRKAGQFVMIRTTQEGERIPLTIADADPVEGSVSLVVQEVGKTTMQMGKLKVGDVILDMAGPLGKPTHVEKKPHTVVIVGGGIGTAPAHPIAQAHKNIGNKVISILGARNKDLLIMEEEMRKTSDEVLVMTDDGSYGIKGLVTEGILSLVARGEKISEVIAIGPPVMMKFVSSTTRPLNIPTTVSLNTIMIDGTGMCGGCRVTVGGKNKFVCVDGPEFDGHLVDWDNMMLRQRSYQDLESESLNRWKEHGSKGCNLHRMADEATAKEETEAKHE